MTLTPKERKTLRHSASEAAGRPAPSDLTRRGFLKGGIAAGVVSGGGLGAFYFGYETSLANPLRVMVVGTGDEGNVLIGAINPDYIDVKAIADIRPYSIHRAFHGDHYSEAALKARPGLMAKYGWKSEDEARKHVKVYEGGVEAPGEKAGYYERLMASAKQDGIEAVIIALPLHDHAPAAIAAMQAGLHVLTEKLMGQTVARCKDMARVAEQTRRHLATGHQRHYNILYADAVDTIRRGILGDLHYIRAQWHRSNMPGRDSWQQPLPKEVKPSDAQAEALLKKLKSWQGQLKKARGREIDVWRKRVAQVEAQLADKLIKDTADDYGYQAKQYKNAAGEVIYDRPAGEELIRWRLWDRTGGGLMAELGSHQLDAASIFISAVHGGKKQHPLNVAAISNRPVFEQDRDVDDHVCCIFEFPAPGYDPKDPQAARKKIGVQYASINGNGFGGYGEIVFGTKGTLILEREQEAKLYRGPSASKVTAGKGAGGATMDTTDTAPAQAAEARGSVAVSRGYTEELEHWAWCIRRNPNVADPEIRPKCHPEVAMADAVIALTTNIAAREGRRIDFQDEWFDPKSDETPDGAKPTVPA
ncbi:MAG: Gfo/Idh/MocA family oxidoreductase [Planctomycetota bacterium]